MSGPLEKIGNWWENFVNDIDEESEVANDARREGRLDAIRRANQVIGGRQIYNQYGLDEYGNIMPVDQNGGFRESRPSVERVRTATGEYGYHANEDAIWGVNIDNNWLGGDLYVSIRGSTAADVEDASPMDNINMILEGQSFANARRPGGSRQAYDFYSGAQVVGVRPGRDGYDNIARLMADQIRELSEPERLLAIQRTVAVFGASGPEGTAFIANLRGRLGDNYEQYFNVPPTLQVSAPTFAAILPGEREVTDTQLRAAVLDGAAEMFRPTGNAAVELTAASTASDRIRAIMTAPSVTSAAGVTPAINIPAITANTPDAELRAAMVARSNALLQVLNEPGLSEADALAALGGAAVLGAEEGVFATSNLAALYLAAGENRDDLINELEGLTDDITDLAARARAEANIRNLTDIGDTVDRRAFVALSAGGDTSHRPSRTGMGDIDVADLRGVEFDDAAMNRRYQAMLDRYEQNEQNGFMGMIMNWFMDLFGMGPRGFVSRNAEHIESAPQSVIDALQGRGVDVSGIQVAATTTENDVPATGADAPTASVAADATRVNAAAQTPLTGNDIRTFEQRLAALGVQGFTADGTLTEAEKAIVARVRTSLHGEQIAGVTLNLNVTAPAEAGVPDARLLAALGLSEAQGILRTDGVAVAPAPVVDAPAAVAVHAGLQGTGHDANKLAALRTALGLGSDTDAAHLMERITIAAAAAGDNRFGITTAALADGLSATELNSINMEALQTAVRGFANVTVDYTGASASSAEITALRRIISPPVETAVVR